MIPPFVAVQLFATAVSIASLSDVDQVRHQLETNATHPRRVLAAIDASDVLQTASIRELLAMLNSLKELEMELGEPLMRVAYADEICQAMRRIFT